MQEDVLESHWILLKSWRDDILFYDDSSFHVNIFGHDNSSRLIGRFFAGMMTGSFALGRGEMSLGGHLLREAFPFIEELLKEGLKFWVPLMLHGLTCLPNQDISGLVIIRLKDLSDAVLRETHPTRRLFQGLHHMLLSNQLPQFLVFACHRLVEQVECGLGAQSLVAIRVWDTFINTRGLTSFHTGQRLLANLNDLLSQLQTQYTSLDARTLSGFQYLAHWTRRIQGVRHPDTLRLAIEFIKRIESYRSFSISTSDQTMVKWTTIALCTGNVELARIHRELYSGDPVFDIHHQYAMEYLQKAVSSSKEALGDQNPLTIFWQRILEKWYIEAGDFTRVNETRSI
jgi:hypothetical protein